MKDTILAAFFALALLVGGTGAAKAGTYMYEVQPGDVMSVNGFCDTEETAHALFRQMAHRTGNLRLNPPVECHPQRDFITVVEVLNQSSSVRSLRGQVVMFTGERDDRWYIGFNTNITEKSGTQGSMNDSGSILTPAGVLVESASATKYMAGDEVPIAAYCKGVNEQWVRDMSAAVVTSGWDGYLDWIKNDHPCYDARIAWHYYNGVRSIMATLLEKLWTIEAEEETIEIWRFADSAGQFGFTWLSPKAIPGVES